MRYLLKIRAPIALMSVVALSGVWAGAARASDPIAYVANEQAGTISQVDLATGVVGTPITVGSEPDGIAITPDDTTAYVADFGSSTIVPVTLATGVVGTPISLADRPSAIAVAPDGKTAYAISDTGREYPITLATGVVGTPTVIPTNSDALAIAPDDTAYIADAADATLRPLLLTDDSFGTPISLDAARPEGIAISADGATAYVTSNSGGSIGPDLMTAHAATNSGGTITPVNLSTGTLGVPIQTGGAPSSIAISADGSTAYITDINTGELTPINVATGVAGTPIGVGAQPSAIALLPTVSTTVYTPPAGGKGGSGSGSGSSTATLGDQQLTLSVTTRPRTSAGSPGGSNPSASNPSASSPSACYRAGSKLGFRLRRRLLPHAAKLRFHKATFTLGKRVKRAQRLPVTVRFSLRGLASGAHTLQVRAFFRESLARAGKGPHRRLTVMLSKTLKTKFRIC